MLWADGVVVGMVVRERHRTVVPDEIAIWGPVSYILIHHDSLFLCGDGNLLSMATWVQETTDRVAKIFQTDRCSRLRSRCADPHGVIFVSHIQAASQAFGLLLSFLFDGHPRSNLRPRYKRLAIVVARAWFQFHVLSLDALSVTVMAK